MMDEKQHVALRLLQEVLPFEAFQQGQQAEIDEFISLLTKHIHILLDTDFAHLCNVCYRMDIDEADFHAVLALAPPKELPHRLALLFWERMLQKAATRLQYRQTT